MTTPDLQKHYDAIARCNRCGFCQVACPVFRATGHETGVARGRLALMRAIIERRIEWSPEVEETFYACLLCGACTANCFPAIQTADLIVAARAEYLKRLGRKPGYKELFGDLLPFPERLRRMTEAIARGTAGDASPQAQALVETFAAGASAGEIGGTFTTVALRDRIKPGVLQGQGKSLRAGYFVGCRMDVMLPGVGERTLQALARACKAVAVLDNVCCGLPAEVYGDLDAARVLAEKNLDILGAQELDLVVTDCSRCAEFLKRYPSLFPEGDARREKAAAVAGRVKDFVEFASSVEMPGPAKGEPVVVTWHDPCRAVRGQKLSAQPRKILKSLPGVEYREMPEADWCCGGAGFCGGTGSALAQKILDRKLDNIAKTGAQVVVTSCPACIEQISSGARRRGMPVRVCHISDFT
jgi:glycolate oxidase iron-sulfur subunit